MKILYLITALGVGGAENLLIDVCESLYESHDITVGFFKDMRHFEPQLHQMGIDTKYFPFYKKSQLPMLLFTLRRFIKKERFDIVHTHLPGADFIGRLAALTVRRVKIISTVHNSDPWKLEKGFPYKMLRLFDYLTVNLFRKVSLLAVSQSAKDFCIKHERIREKKIKVLYNFINFDNPLKEKEDFVPLFDKEKYFIIVSVARLEPNKGHMFLFDAVDMIRQQKELSNIRLIVMGGGSKDEEYRNYVHDKELDEYIIFVGRQPNVYDYLKSSSLFVLASENEGQSIAVLESFYCKTPVLVADNESNVELLKEGANGVLFPYGNTEDFAAKIKGFMLNKYDVKRFTHNGYEFAQIFSKHRHVVVLEGYMRSITRKRKKK